MQPDHVCSPVRQHGMEGLQRAQTGSGPPLCLEALYDKIHMKMPKLGILALCDSVVRMKVKNEHIN